MLFPSQCSTFYLFSLLILPYLVTAAQPAFACAPWTDVSNLPFCNVNLPIQTRVQDLLWRLTIEEKLGLLVSSASSVPRLGIGAYEWWSESLHGVSYACLGVHFEGQIRAATSFPQVITTAASFNESLWGLIAMAVSDEMRAMYNVGQSGLTVWSPNVNVFVDPRWGRGQETPGEDPVMVGKYAVAYVQGLQQRYIGQTGSARLKLAATCKHFTAYSLEDWNGFSRYSFNAWVSQQDLEDTYNVPFRACVVQANAAGVMCTYNQINGVPSCANKDLLKGTIRDQWNLDGYIVSDCDAVGVFYHAQGYTASPEDAVAAALNAGLDLSCGKFLAENVQSALNQGKITETNVDTALNNTLTVQMKLGMFDGNPSDQPYGYLGPNDVCSPTHQNLALEAARQGIVLLKNDYNALPLSSDVHRRVAIIGPNSVDAGIMLGDYNGIPCKYISPLQAIGSYAETIYQIGCTNVACQGDQPIEAAVDAARNTDASILIVGLDWTIEGEQKDRIDLLLPGRQEDLVSNVAMASKGPFILVIMSGGPVDISFAKNNPNVSAIIWAGYGGEAGGIAIADVIFGAYNPGGKLPMTWYPQEYVEQISMAVMGMRADSSWNYPGRTYRFYTGPTVYPFGYGLSYTQFSHSLTDAPTQLSVPLDRQILMSVNSTEPTQAVRVEYARCDGLYIPLQIDVNNDGYRDGTYTVLVYTTTPVSYSAPVKQLVGFERVYVAAGSQARVELTLDVCNDLSFVDTDGVRMIPFGEHKLQIGELNHSVTLVMT
ncbi:hypothetical protein LUZ60_015837 [Juncus effusus]|nr:hypothetical protein LUZ60_015837 [Juncus effusus]